MRYCGNCGEPLDDLALTNRQCSFCGAEIHSSGDVRYDGDGGTRAGSAPVMGTDSTSPYVPVYGQVAPPPPRAVPPRPRLPLALVSVVMLVLLLTAVLRFTLTRPAPSTTASLPLATSTSVTLASGGGTPPHASPPVATAQPVATSPSATQTSVVQPTATSVAGLSPTATLVPSVTPAPGPSATATLAPPLLNVTPQTLTTKCFDGTFSFTISNGGQAAMAWNATDSAGDQFSPNGGTLMGQQSVAVTTNHVISLVDITVTVSAPAAPNSPTLIKVHCTQ
jgi:hypothetical protein